MKNLKRTNRYQIDKFLIEFDDDLQFHTYVDKWYYGIIFITANGRYEIIHNYFLGNRLLINNDEFSCKDIPFKQETFSFLPNNIIVTEL